MPAWSILKRENMPALVPLSWTFEGESSKANSVHESVHTEPQAHDRARLYSSLNITNKWSGKSRPLLRKTDISCTKMTKNTNRNAHQRLETYPVDIQHPMAIFSDKNWEFLRRSWSGFVPCIDVLVCAGTVDVHSHTHAHTDVLHFVHTPWIATYCEAMSHSLAWRVRNKRARVEFLLRTRGFLRRQIFTVTGY